MKKNISSRKVAKPQRFFIKKWPFLASLRRCVMIKASYGFSRLAHSGVQLTTDKGQLTPVLYWHNRPVGRLVKLAKPAQPAKLAKPAKRQN